jgi:hypothetical protein
LTSSTAIRRREAWESGREIGKASLRRTQIAVAQQGNPTMLIWLGKQMLNQKDKIAEEVSGPEGKPLVERITHIEIIGLDPEPGQFDRIAHCIDLKPNAR